MRGLILAAGRGSRLGNYNQTAKCLLEVAGRRLVDYQLEACAEAGVAPVAIVVGYCADDVREAVGIKAEYIHNARWEFTNSMVSFLLARDWINGPIVVMNSDILFHPEILTRVLAIQGDALAYDSSSGSAPEHMKVAVEDGRLIDMSKQLDAGRVAGENVGLLVFSEAGARDLLDRAAAIAEAGGEKNWLGAAVREVATEREIRAVDIAGLPWGEIDSTFDLENVRKNVWPRIQRSTGKRRRRRRLLLGMSAAALVLVAVALGVFVVPRRGAIAAVPDPAWETVDATGGVERFLMVDGRRQRWRLLSGEETVWADAVGPGPLRVETRLLLPVPPPTRMPYVVRIQVGREYDLYKRTGRPDDGVVLESRPVARRKRDTIELGAGAHRIAISLLGADQVLVRLRQPEPPDTPDDDADRDDASVSAFP
jgi:choline kinase